MSTSIETTLKEDGEATIYVSYDTDEPSVGGPIFLAINGKREADTHMSLARARMLVKALEALIGVADGAGES